MATKRLRGKQREYARCKGFGHTWFDIDAGQLFDLGVRQATLEGWGVIAQRCDYCTRIRFYRGDPKTDTWQAPRYINTPEDYHEVTMTRLEWKSAYFRVYSNGRK